MSHHCGFDFADANQPTAVCACGAVATNPMLSVQNGFDFIKPVENHPEEICCTDCWQRGIAWGSAGREEKIIELLESLKGTCDNDCDECRPHAERNAHYLTALQELIKGQKK